MVGSASKASVKTKTILRPSRKKHYCSAAISHQEGIDEMED
jgi:hypothetical protein